MGPEEWDDLIDIIALIAIEPISDIQVRINAIKKLKAIFDYDVKNLEYLGSAKEFF